MVVLLSADSAADRSETGNNLIEPSDRERISRSVHGAEAEEEEAGLLGVGGVEAGTVQLYDWV